MSNCEVLDPQMLVVSHWRWKRLDWNLQFISALFSVAVAGHWFPLWATSEVTVPSRTLPLNMSIQKNKI